jgi:zinc/manganese transport system substrate-binding protein
VAIGVTARLSELDPEHSEAYNAKLGAFLKRLHRERQGYEKRLKPYRGTAVLAYHDSWVYLTDWLGLKTIAFLEPKPGIPPNPGHVAKVLVAARRAKAKLVLQENYYPNATAELVAKKSGAKVVTMPGGADFRAGQSYFAHLGEVVQRLESKLR